MFSCPQHHATKQKMKTAKIALLIVMMKLFMDTYAEESKGNLKGRSLAFHLNNHSSNSITRAFHFLSIETKWDIVGVIQFVM